MALVAGTIALVIGRMNSMKEIKDCDELKGDCSCAFVFVDS